LRERRHRGRTNAKDTKDTKKLDSHDSVSFVSFVLKHRYESGDALPIGGEHPRHLRRLLSRYLPPQQRRRDESGRVVVVHERLHRETIAELLLARRQQRLELDL